MRFLDLLKRGVGLKKKSAQLTPIRTVRDPAEVRQETLARRAKTAGELEPPPPVKDKEERDFFDTGSLEMARDPGDGDNPYDTQTWQVSSPQGPRRVDDLRAVNKDRKSGEADNPYDTIVTKKGW